MKNERETAEILRKDRALFSSLLKHIVQAKPNEDPSDFVLASIGRNVGADRCYVYRFWEPGKSSMCTNTHEWCAEGIKPEIDGQQTCNLADLVEFNAHITAGRDFLFTDINAIDAGSRDWLQPQGIQSLIATPLVGTSGTILGFVGFDFAKEPCGEFSESILFNIHEAADLLLDCQRLHEQDMALLDITRRENEHLESDRDLENALAEFQKDVSLMRPTQMLEIVRSRLDADLCYVVQDIRPEGGGTIRPEHALARGGWTNALSWPIDPSVGRALDMRLMSSSIVGFRDREIDWLKANIGREKDAADLADRLKIVHSTGVLQEGRLVGVLCAGFFEERPLTPLQSGFLRRSSLVIVSSLERIATYHDLSVALDLAHLKGDIVEFMFHHQDYREIRDYIGEKVRMTSGAQHLMFSSEDGTRFDWFGEDAPPRCRDCARTAVHFGKHLPMELFSEDDTVIVAEGTPLPDMNLPRYCPMRSAVVCQLRRDDGWWRLAADYTKPHGHNLSEVARGLREALELLSIAYERERHEKTIARLQEHQRFRADTLAYALSKDDLPGLIDRTLHRLLELTQCDYIAIHTADGDHRLLHSGGALESCPERCSHCSFYKLHIPPLKNEDETLEFCDAKGQTLAPIPSECPAKSLEVAIVNCDGKHWGGIALHYLNRQSRISEDDKDALRIAADVLTLALERHSAAVRLKAERDRVVEAEKARSYFFSAVSHDIRTPLNAIIGFSELLQAGSLPPEETTRTLKMIVASGKTLLQLVNDVIDLSKMDLGKLKFRLEPTDVGELVRDILPVFQPMIGPKRQTIATEISALPRLLIDPHRFRQVLFNLLSNAVKYAGPCTIRVVVAYENGLLKLTVADNGVGISAEKAKLLMQPFVQADIKNRTEGSGLGLAICRRLAELVNGTISIKTAPGEGFTVHTEVPVDIAVVDEGDREEAQTSTAAAEEDLPRRILVVDDSPMNRLVLKAILKKFGITDVELAEDGREALERLEGNLPFDLVLTDMWMPVMDGAELIRRIRADERFARLKVCAITADVEARANCRELGFDEILLKPVTLDSMMAVLREAMA